MDNLTGARNTGKFSSRTKTTQNVSKQERDQGFVARKAIVFPHIEIDIFFDRNDTADLMEMLCHDKHMANADFRLHRDSVATASGFYHDMGTPNLIIIEYDKPVQVIIDALEELANVCDAATKVIVIGHHDDPDVYRTLIKMGVSDYIVSPKSVSPIIEAIQESFDWSEPMQEDLDKVQTIAVMGARGGVGASMVAQNMAFLAGSEPAYEALLVDLDLHFGTSAVGFSKKADDSLVKMLGGGDVMDPFVVRKMAKKVRGHFSMLPAPCMLNGRHDYAEEAYENVVRLCRKTARVVVLDLPNVWTSWSRKILLEASKIIIVAAPDIVSFRNLRNILNYVVGYDRSLSRVHVVLNGAGMPKRPEIGLSRYQEKIGIKPDLVIGWHPYYFGEAETKGKIIAQYMPEAKIVQNMHMFVDHVLGRKTKAAAPRPSFIGKLRKTFG